MATNSSEPKQPKDRSGEPVWVVQLAGIAALVYFVRLEAQVPDFSVNSIVWGILAVAILGPERASNWLAEFRGR